ncbi:MBL fold metallo-hydrolase [Streptomyces sp. NPDC058867]|uniref:MBL fold metallo-hydrolase n=1 Tax=unclassified Streptomyces TaxID=2593676 RepID=UPI00367DB6AD
MTEARIAHIGGPTTLIEVTGRRLLTDPTFDPPGRRYAFGWGTCSRKAVGPAVDPTALQPLDAVLLTHDHHADNLDTAGRALLPSARHGTLWISGDTVLYDGVREVARRLDVGTALLHLGGVRFPVTGPLRYTLTARHAVDLCRELRPRTVVPVHYEGRPTSGKGGGGSRRNSCARRPISAPPSAGRPSVRP